MRKIAHILWLLPGFLLWAAFPPMAENVDALFALAPLLWLSRQGDVRKSCRCWFLNGLVFWAATLSWMPAIIKNNGPWPLVLLGQLGLAAYCALYFGAFGYLAAKFWSWYNFRAATPYYRGRNWYYHLLFVLVVEPVLWCGLELVRSRLFGGFAWNQLGVVAVNGGFGEPAALGGVYLCSAVVVLINGTFAGIAERMIAACRREKVERWRTFETLAAFLLVYLVYCGEPTRGHASAEPVQLKVGLVQRNFPCCFSTCRENPMERYAELVQNLAYVRPELLVLPESAMCEFGDVGSANARHFAAALARETGALAVLAGGSRTDEARRIYNSAALYTFTEKGDVELGIYDKVHLVPFGEFIPGDKWFPALQRLAPVGSCTPGEPKLLTLPSSGERPPIKLAVAICYEDTDSALVRQFAELGAELLVFITNDSWFSHSVEALQHAWQARARAIETGLPVVRVGNSGVTGTITPDGRCSWLNDGDNSPLVDKAAAMCDMVTVGAGTTFYCRFGDWPLGISFALVLLWLFGLYHHRIK